MASEKDHDGELQRYLDGDLSREEARAVERRVAASPEAQLKLDALEQLGEVVVARYQAATSEAEPGLEALWSQIQRQLQPAAARRGWWAGLREWFDAYRSHVMTGGLAAVAGAAIALVAARGETKVIFVKQPTAMFARAEDAEVESLEVPSGTGTVFQIPSDQQGEAATTVIWLNKDDEAGSPTEGPI